MARTINPTKEFQTKLKLAEKKATENMRATRLKSDTAINYELRKKSIELMTSALKECYEELDLDESMLERKLNVVRRSEYGRVPALINILCALYAWPIVQGGDASAISSYQEDMLATLAKRGIEVDGDLLLDIKEAKGFHSFMSDEGEIIDTVTPDYEEYEFFILTFAERAGLPIVDLKLNENAWERNETKELFKITKEKELQAEALARHEAMKAKVA